MERRDIMLVALYIRVSTSEQAEFGFSVPAQSKLLKEYSQQNSWRIYDIYTDNGLSGKSASNRPELQRLLEDAKLGKFQKVLVWKINRLARNVIDLLEITEELNRHQVSLQSISEQFDLSSPLGQFTLQMMAAVGELERKTIAENIQMGRHQRNKRGIYCGASILGYETRTIAYQSQRRKTTELYIVPEEAQLVRSIFLMYSEGKGLKAIVNFLNINGFQSKHQKPFSISTIRKILNNPVYIGNIQYFEPSLQQNVIVEGHHEPIIPMELWNKVKERLRNNQRKPSKIIERCYPLSSILRCPICDSSMIPFNTTQHRKNGQKVTYHYYICNQYQNKGIAVCKPNSIPADKIEQLILSKLKNIINHPSLLKDIVGRINSSLEEKQKMLQRQIGSINKQLNETKSKKQRCFSLFEDEVMDKATFVDRISSYKEQEASFSKEKEQVEFEISQLILKLVSFQEVQSLLIKFEELWPSASEEQQKVLVKSLIEKVTINKVREFESVKIYFQPEILPLIVDESNPLQHQN
jgi:site-specific DNA recombinase